MIRLCLTKIVNICDGVPGACQVYDKVYWEFEIQLFLKKLFQFDLQIEHLNEFNKIHAALQNLNNDDLKDELKAILL